MSTFFIATAWMLFGVQIPLTSLSSPLSLAMTVITLVCAISVTVLE